jgi:hypothetical protein
MLFSFKSATLVALMVSTLIVTGMVSIPVDTMAEYKISENENSVYNKLTKDKLIVDLVERYQKPFSEDPVLATQESQEIKQRLQNLKPDELIAFKRLSRKTSDVDLSSKNGIKKSIIMNKFDRDLVKSFEQKYGKEKTQYNIRGNNKQILDEYIKSNNNLVDLIKKYKNPDTIPDSVFGVKTEAATTICGFDNNWPSSLPSMSSNWQGPTYWYNPTTSGDARNSWTPSDALCDFKIGGVPSNMKAIHGRNYQGYDAIDCWPSLIARSEKNETLSGSGCAIGAGIWHHWDLKNNVRFRKY